jgi:hypothetical protein
VRRLRTSQVAVTVNAETQSQAAAAAAAVWQGTAASSVSTCKVAEEPWPGGSYRASDKRMGSARKTRICKELLQEEVAAVDAAGTWILVCPETKPI